jgi:hypothetical protein
MREKEDGCVNGLPIYVALESAWRRMNAFAPPAGGVLPAARSQIVGGFGKRALL